jgi:hypothetical protein
MTTRPPYPHTFVPSRPLDAHMTVKKKIKTITLETCSNGYEVIKLTDTVAYTCGDTLLRNEVERLCDSPDWSVRIFRKGEAPRE